MQHFISIEAVKEQYDLFFLRFYTLYYQQVLQQDRTFTNSHNLPIGAVDCWIEGWREIEPRLQAGGQAYVMLSDRMCAGVKINVHVQPIDGGWEIEFQVSPTYLQDKSRKKMEKKVIPALQAAKFKVKYP